MRTSRHRIGLAVFLCALCAGTGALVDAFSLSPLPLAPPHPYRERLLRSYSLAFPDHPSEAEQSSILLKGCCGEGSAAALPCSIATTCVGAHSLNRRMVVGYSGNLFQLSRTGGGGGTQNIGMIANGTVDTGAIGTFCGSTWPMSNGAGANSCAIHIVYDQSGNSNPITDCGACTDIPFASNPANNLPWAATGTTNQYLNIDFATNAPSGTADKTVMMVANDTNTANNACGEYGMYHRVADASTTGTDFAIDMRSGINGEPVRLMGTDLEQDVIEVAYGYGNTDVIPASTNLQTPRDYVGVATSANTGAPVVVNWNGVYSYTHTYVPSSGTMNTGASMRLGAGGDGCAAGGYWYEGLIANTAISTTTTSTLIANEQTFFGISTAGSCTEGANSQSVNHFVTTTGTWGLRLEVPTGMTPTAVIERASDSTVKIINASGCDFDSSTASTFCNATTCRVMLLPNQAPWPAFGHQDLYTQSITCSFCTTYLEQTTFASAPALTFNCVGSTKVCMTFTGSESLASKNNQTVSIPYSVFAVSNRNSGATYGSTFGDAGNVMFLGGGNGANLMLFQANSSGAVDTVTAADGTWFAIAGTAPSGSTSENACVAGTCTLLSSITTTGITNVQYGIGIGFNDWKGTITETALVPSDVTSSVGSIATAQKNYWGY